MGDGTPQNRDWKAARPSCQRLRGRGGEKSLEDKRNRDRKAAGPFSQQLRGRGGEKSLEDKRNRNRLRLRGRGREKSFAAHIETETEKMRGLFVKAEEEP